MKLLAAVALLFSCFVFLGCNRSDQSNSRAYIEGKISGQQITYNEIPVKILNDNLIVAETLPDAAGNFTLSGPLISKKYALVFSRKVKSFTASKSGCQIGSDPQQILIPEGITYITFNEIVLE